MIRERLRSSSRITIFSPHTVSIVATRTSSSRPSTFTLIWPSCARLRSTMFMPAMILTLELSAAPVDVGRWAMSWSTPSIRKRMRR